MGSSLFIRESKHNVQRHLGNETVLPIGASNLRENFETSDPGGRDRAAAYLRSR